METIQKPILIKKLGMEYPNKTSKQKRSYGLFRCHCGKEFNTQIYLVNCGKTISCGCYKSYKLSKNKTTHGMRRHRLYNIWSGMIQRCNNKNHSAYKYYGGSGIKICDRWLDVGNFIKDMFPSYKEGLTIDRIDSNGNYEPKNCRWATWVEQSTNQRLIKSNNKSGYKGISYYSKRERWVAEISINTKRKKIGYFKCRLEAAYARDKYISDNNLPNQMNFT